MRRNWVHALPCSQYHSNVVMRRLKAQMSAIRLVIPLVKSGDLERRIGDWPPVFCCFRNFVPLIIVSGERVCFERSP